MSLSRDLQIILYQSNLLCLFDFLFSFQCLLYSQSLRIPAPPRLIAPPLHVPPLHPPPLRPVWNQRRGPLPVVGSDLKPCSTPSSKISSSTS